jgi:hypothetical protein
MSEREGPMRRRRRTITILVALVAAFTLPMIWPRGPRPCRATFEQVREGKTREEVIATVGGPPGDYTGGRCLDGWTGKGEYWTATDGVLKIAFDTHGRVAYVRTYEPTLLPDPPWWTRLRSRVGI